MRENGLYNEMKNELAKSRGRVDAIGDAIRALEIEKAVLVARNSAMFDILDKYDPKKATGGA